MYEFQELYECKNLCLSFINVNWNICFLDTFFLLSPVARTTAFHPEKLHFRSIYITKHLFRLVLLNMMQYGHGQQWVWFLALLWLFCLLLFAKSLEAGTRELSLPYLRIVFQPKVSFNHILRGEEGSGGKVANLLSGNLCCATFVHGSMSMLLICISRNQICEAGVLQ